MAEHSEQPPPRGAVVEIGGGRRMRAVRAGPTASLHPLVLLEAGAFGFSADWAVVQERLAVKGLRSLAYDRAGLGFSDPGPGPRDGLAIAGDLEALLAAIGEGGPLILCGHSMAGLHLRLYAGRNPARVAGVVLVDATTPEAMDSKLVSGFVDRFAGVSKMAAWGARSGLFAPLAKAGVADGIGLTGPAREEKRWAFADPVHNHWAADEAAQWPRAAAQARAAGRFDPALPVAVILAGSPEGTERWKSLQAAPANASRHGSIDHVRGASHANILGARFADRVVRGIENVRAVAESTDHSSAPG